MVHKDVEKRKAYARKWMKNHPASPEYRRTLSLRFHYGISIEEYDEMLLAQNGKCAICGRVGSGSMKDGKEKRMYVDHDHSTGRVRGLLCRKCNLALGSIGDDPEIALKIIGYLTSSKL